MLGFRRHPFLERITSISVLEAHQLLQKTLASKDEQCTDTMSRPESEDDYHEQGHPQKQNKAELVINVITYFIRLGKARHLGPC